MCSFLTNLPVYSTRIAIAVQQQRASESADEMALRLVKDSLPEKHKHEHTQDSLVTRPEMR